jgi:hypothetical protein
MFDIELENYKIDHFCKMAKEFTKHDGLCTECPFLDCIDDLKPLEKSLILQSGTIKQVYANYDNCPDIKKISTVLDMTYHKVYQWISNRDKIEAKLNAYLPV